MFTIQELLSAFLFLIINFKRRVPPQPQPCPWHYCTLFVPSLYYVVFIKSLITASTCQHRLKGQRQQYKLLTSAEDRINWHEHHREFHTTIGHMFNLAQLPKNTPTCILLPLTPNCSSGSEPRGKCCICTLNWIIHALVSLWICKQGQEML